MLQAIKIRLYPNKEQTRKINSFIGSCRVVYNECLKHKINLWETEKKSIGFNELGKYLTHHLKTEFKWLNEAPAQVLQQALIDLDTAYSNFFRTKKGYPKKKKKKDRKQSVRFPNQSISKKPFNDNVSKLNISKIEGLKFRCSDAYKELLVKSEIRQITISRTPSGKFYASVLINTDAKKISEPTNESIGIDLGIKTLMAFSDGTNIDNPKWLRKNEKKLKKLQRNLSKKQNGSNNSKKAALKIAKLHEKLKNQKQDFLHKQTTKIINDNQVIILEDLNVKGMLKNHRIAKAIAEISLGEFERQLKYKSEWYNRTFILIDRFYPSTQTCSNCGYVKKGKEKLHQGIRTYKCSCGHVMDRDTNAAINIQKEGLRIYNS